MPDDDSTDAEATARLNRMIDVAADVKARAIVQSIYIQSLIELRSAVLHLTDRIDSLEDNFIGMTSLLVNDDDDADHDPDETDL